MKITMAKGRNLLVLLFTSIFLGISFHACFDSSDGEYKTFEEQQIASFLESDKQQRFVEFYDLMKACGVADLLNAYGTYTCFAPTNEAVLKYYAENNTSREQLTDEEVRTIVFNHIISAIYESVDLPNGTISTSNMNERFIQISIGEGNNITVNKTANIIDEDNVVHNGVVHVIDQVLEASKVQIPDVILDADRFSIFAQALFETGLADSLRGTESSYEYLGKFISESTYRTGEEIDSPKKCIIGYTVLMESDSVYALNGIHSYEDLKNYAKQVYDRLYPDDRGISEVQNRRNSLNRFMAYHLMDRMLDVNEFIPANRADYYLTGTIIYDYIETMCPNTMLEVQTGNKFNLNMNTGSYVTIASGVGTNFVAENGVAHEIDKILTYEDVERYALDKRIRMDVASVMSEMTTNKVRGDFTGYIIPNTFFKNLQYTDATQCQYIGSSVWADCQGDEFLFVGKYDFSLTTPPIPAGTYEVRVGYSANARRGVAQIYFDGLPCGIPLDMRITANNAKIGWVADSETTDDGVENDKMMRNRGYLKGPTSIVYGSSKTQLRNNSQSLRRIITTTTFTETAAHTLRIKSVMDDLTMEFHLDFIEFVPSSIWEDEGRD